MLPKPPERSNPHSLAWSIALLLITAFFAISLFSYSAQDPSFGSATDNLPQNWLGLTGAYTADALFQTFGMGAFLFVLLPALWTIQMLMHKEIKVFGLRLLCGLLSILLASTMLDSLTDEHTSLYGGGVGRTINILTMGIDPLYKLLAEASLFLLSLYVASSSSIRILVLSAWQSAISIAQALGLLFNKTKNSAQRVTSLLNKEDNDIPFAASKPSPPPIKLATPTPAVQKEEPTNSVLPSTELLGPLKKQKASSVSDKVLQARAEELIKILKDFGVNGVIHHYYSGPVVTLYEFEPAAGIKSSRVIGLSDDIARVMRVLSTRIAVIPGKNSLGIEIPNETREIVFLREVLDSAEYKNGKQKLPLVLGKDILGGIVIADLAHMPHLLVAGTTGSGKSVAVNTMILSLLFRYTPEECKFVMIDPKMLELSVYQGIPHLLAPVVTEASKAVTALKWTVKEMENRYRLMSYLNVRGLEGYNQAMEQALRNGTDLTKKVQVGFSPETGKPIYEQIEIKLQKLPFIVVIVDEMADLMIVAGKEIESLIQRLAQMARAAGIHIITATQRPSVDVITGVIKANLPTRISFQVTSKIDSRTILGEMGAEQLVGKGDMLYMSGGNKILRVHGPFVSDSEVENVVSFLKSQSPPTYSVDITSDSWVTQGGPSASGEKDELYDEAVAMVLRERKASTSFVQRCFKIGYNRAALIIEQMEKSGVIGQPNHVGKREILVNE
jgi:S-DNA-T family DNA segregation ATPase FtsK/SpoIIIE